MKMLIIGTEKQVICTGVVGLASPAARTINYHLVCFSLICDWI